MIHQRLSPITGCAAALALGVCLAPPAHSQGALEVSRRARAIAPGELVEVVVAGASPLAAVTAEGFGQRVVFVEGADGRWRGLVGLDLDTPPGPGVLVISTLVAGGAPGPAAREVLDVQQKAFPTRHVTVDDSYVNPPAGVLARIERESTRVQAILAGVTPSRHWTEPFVPPVPGPSISSFGRRSVFNGQPRSPHSGTDFRAATGTPVKAPNRGRVVLAEELYFSGNVVVIDHGLGMYSLLAHLSTIAVSEGQAVAPGEVVGLSGATGRVSGPHLHWTVRLNGARVDPLAVLDILGRK